MDNDNPNVMDRDGNEWTPTVNEYHQRKLRCVAGPREGDVIDDPRLDKGVGISTQDNPMRPARSSWQEAIERPGFWT